MKVSKENEISNFDEISKEYPDFDSLSEYEKIRISIAYKLATTQDNMLRLHCDIYDNEQPKALYFFPRLIQHPCLPVGRN